MSRLGARDGSTMANEDVTPEKVDALIAELKNRV